MAEVINFHDQIRLINELVSDFEVYERQLIQLQQDLADGEQRVAVLDAIHVRFGIILAELRNLGENIDPDLTNDYNKEITTKMVTVLPDDVHLEPTYITSYQHVNSAIPAVITAQEEANEIVEFMRSSVEQAQRILDETRANLLQKITELSTDITTFCEIVRNLVN